MMLRSRPNNCSIHEFDQEQPMLLPQLKQR